MGGGGPGGKPGLICAANGLGRSPRPPRSAEYDIPRPLPRPFELNGTPPNERPECRAFDFTTSISVWSRVGGGNLTPRRSIDLCTADVFGIS